MRSVSTRASAVNVSALFYRLIIEVGGWGWNWQSLAAIARQICLILRANQAYCVCAGRAFY